MLLSVERVKSPGVGCPVRVTNPSPLSLKADTVNERWAIANGVKLSEEGTEYRVSCDERARVTWYAINFGTVNRGTLLGRKYFESVDGTGRNPNVEDDRQIKHDEDGLFDEPGWTHDEIQPSASYNVRHNVRSTFCNVEGLVLQTVLGLQRTFVRCVRSSVKDCRRFSTCGLAMLQGHRQDAGVHGCKRQSDPVIHHGVHSFW